MRWQKSDENKSRRSNNGECLKYLPRDSPRKGSIRKRCDGVPYVGRSHTLRPDWLIWGLGLHGVVTSLAMRKSDGFNSHKFHFNQDGVDCESPDWFIGLKKIGEDSNDSNCFCVVPIVSNNEKAKIAAKPATANCNSIVKAFAIIHMTM